VAPAAQIQKWPPLELTHRGIVKRFPWRKRGPRVLSRISERCLLTVPEGGGKEKALLDREKATGDAGKSTLRHHHGYRKREGEKAGSQIVPCTTLPSH